MDKNNKLFAVFQVIGIVVIAIIALGLCYVVFNTIFEDPIEKIKNNILTIQLVMIGFSVITTLLVSIFIKNKKKLVYKFILIAILSIVMIIVQMIIKVYMDNKYNEKTFEELYEQYNFNDEHKKGISVGLNGVKIVSAKESYIQKSITLYNIFKIRTMLFIIIHVIFVILILYLIIKLMSIEEKRAKLAKDDLIIRDKEQ